MTSATTTADEVTSPIADERSEADKQATPLVDKAMVKAHIVSAMSYFLVAIFAPWIAPYGMAEVVSRDIWAPSSPEFLLGTDNLGRDTLGRLLIGGRISLAVGLAAMILSVLLGTLIGVGRLSSNWIVNKIATVYIETIRNIPLLVQIFFWSAIAISLPPLTEADVGTYWFKASNKGFAFAWIFPDGGFWPWLVFVVVGIFVVSFSFSSSVSVSKARRVLRLKNFLKRIHFIKFKSTTWKRTPRMI